MNALKMQEEDRLALEGIKEKMGRVEEFEAKLVASEPKVATFHAELLQANEQLGKK